MATFASTKPISTARQRLLELCRAIHFGRIENLKIVNGEPDLVAKPRVVRERKFGSDAETPHRGDYLMRPHVCDFLKLLDEIRNGEISRLDVHHGLPFKAEFQV